MVEVGVASPDARHILINTQTSSETGDPELRAIRWPFSQPLLESWGTDNRKWLSPPPSLPRGIRFAGLASRDSAFVITFNAPLPEHERRISKLCRSLLADFFFLGMVERKMANNIYRWVEVFECLEGWRFSRLFGGDYMIRLVFIWWVEFHFIYLIMLSMMNNLSYRYIIIMNEN